MITGLDHFVLMCPDIEAGTDAYAKLLGIAPAWQWADAEAGAAMSLFRVGNTAIELIAPKGTGLLATRLGALLDDDGPRLASLAFAADDLDEAHRLLPRRGLNPGPVASGHAQPEGLDPQSWRSFRCDDKAMAGVRTFVMSPRTAEVPFTRGDAGSVVALDHLVVGTPNPDRAAAIYGTRLGLRLALDRREDRWKTHFLFFRTGGLTLEVVQRLDLEQPPTDPARLFGLTWETADIRAAHARLTQHGFDLSDVRKGRRPGSEVFTVRDGTLGVPTLFITQAPR